MSAPVLLIDGNNLACRCHFKLSTLRSEVMQMNTGAIHGFFIALLQLHRTMPEHKIIVAFDGGRAAWRMAMYPKYKANRESSTAKSEMYLQFAVLRTALQLAGIPALSYDHCEADDLLAMIALTSDIGAGSILYSSDEDFLQLKGGKIEIVSPATNEPNGTLEKLQCTPHQFLLAKALAGDSSDNIAGLAGIGIKGALQALKAKGIHELKELGEDHTIASFREIGKKWKVSFDEESFGTIVTRNYSLMSLHQGVLWLPDYVKSAAPIEAASRGRFKDLVALRMLFDQYELKTLSGKINEIEQL
jgi:DNA polymerase-1